MSVRRSTVQVVDVAVVGGGPAGSTVATLLARRGWSVTLCDAARFPRHKICGEYIPPAAIRHFSDLGVLSEVERLGPRRHIGMAVIAPGGAEVLGRYGERGPFGLALRRYDLDHLLLGNASRNGVRVIEAARLTGLDRRPGGRFDLTFTTSPTVDGSAEDLSAPAGKSAGEDMLRIDAGAVVGADGRNSFVARRLGLHRLDRHHRRWAVMGHFRDVSGPGDHGEMIVTDYGYCGINPLPGGLTNVCIVVDPSRRGQALTGRSRLESFFDERIASHPLTRTRMAGASLDGELRATGPMACRPASSIADGVLLVGDAAGFYDPFTGEGIAMALRGAEMAADVLDGALRRGDLSRPALLPYEKRRTAAFTNRIRLDRILQALLRRRRLTDWVAVRLRRDIGLADLLARVTGDTADASEVLRARFLLRLLRA